MEHDDSAALLQARHVEEAGGDGHAGPRPHPARDLATKLRAFDLGVDDIDDPFSPRLLARAVVITRRASGIDRPIVPTIRLGEMEIDILNREVRAGTSVVHLSSIEQALLYLLASRGGRVVTRDEILDGVWGTDFVAESNIVDRHIRGLRVKLQNDYRHPRFIATVPGRGYRFIPTYSDQGWAEGSDEPEAYPTEPVMTAVMTDTIPFQSERVSPLKAHIDAPLPPYDQGRWGALVVGSGRRSRRCVCQQRLPRARYGSQPGVWAADRRRL